MGTNFYWIQPKAEPRERAVVKAMAKAYGNIDSDVLVDMTGEQVGEALVDAALRAADSWEPESIDMDSPDIHIGKRSAAGRYCWDDMVTLMEGGEAMIHTGRGEMLDACPKCGKPFVAEKGSGLTTGAAAVELGFAQPNTERPTGVGSASSFSWAQEPDRLAAAYLETPDEKLIEDEYGRQFTPREFTAMLDAQCPIRFTEMIGRYFS